MTLSVKDPSEKIVLTFDFTQLPNPISSPVVSIGERGQGNDLSSTMLVDVPQVQGNKVLQLVQGGESGLFYETRCQVDVVVTGERFVAKDILPVKY